MALDLRMKNGFRAISFEYIGVLDSYFIHMYIIIKYRSSSIMDKIHQLLSELWPFVKWQCSIYGNLAIAGASVSHGHISSFLSASVFCLCSKVNSMDPDQTAPLSGLILFTSMKKPSLKCTWIHVYATDIKSRQIFQDKNRGRVRLKKLLLFLCR